MGCNSCKPSFQQYPLHERQYSTKVIPLRAERLFLKPVLVDATFITLLSFIYLFVIGLFMMFLFIQFISFSIMDKPVSYLVPRN